jgi:flagellar hook-associated protein 3 FlgL
MISGTRYQLQLQVNRQLSLSAQIARGLAEVSSGKRILAPSDDPVGAARVSDISRSHANLAVWQTNLDTAAALSATADDVLAGVERGLVRAKELMLAASNGTLSQENRNATALELASIAEEVAMLRDTRDSRGELLFSTSAALRVPVGPDLDIGAIGTRQEIFDSVTTASGTSDVISILNSAVTALRSGSPAAIAAALGATDAATGHMIAARSEQGSRGNRIDTLMERSETTNMRLEEERSAVEGADITEVIARLQSRQLSLEAAQATFARINKSTLFDLLS